MISNCTKLPLRATLREAYGRLWRYKLPHSLISLIALLPFTCAGLAGFLTPVFSTAASPDHVTEGFNLSLLILVLTVFVWAVPCIILWHRLFLLGPQHLVRRKILPIWSRSITLVIQMLILLGAGLLMALGLILVIFYLIDIISIQAGGSDIHEMAGRELFLYTAGLVLVVTFVTLIAMRFSLVFSARSIGKALGFRTSWCLTRVNSWRMLIAATLTTFPAVTCFYLLVITIHAFGPNSRLLYLLVLLLAPLLTSPLALFCSLTSVFYRHCGAETHRE